MDILIILFIVLMIVTAVGVSVAAADPRNGLARKSDFSVQPLCLCVSVVVFTNNSLTTEAHL